MSHPFFCHFLTKTNCLPPPSSFLHPLLLLPLLQVPSLRYSAARLQASPFRPNLFFPAPFATPAGNPAADPEKAPIHFPEQTDKAAAITGVTVRPRKSTHKNNSFITLSHLLFLKSLSPSWGYPGLSWSILILLTILVSIVLYHLPKLLCLLLA